MEMSVLTADTKKQNKKKTTKISAVGSEKKREERISHHLQEDTLHGCYQKDEHQIEDINIKQVQNRGHKERH